MVKPIEPTEPTEQQRKLVAYAEACESEGGMKTSLYYRLMPQIMDAQIAINKWERKNHG